MKKILRILIIFLLFFSVSSSAIFAATMPSNYNNILHPSIEQYKQTLRDAQKTGQASLEVWVYQVGYNTMLSVTDFLLCVYSCDENNSGNKPAGLQGMLAAATGVLYFSKPVSGVEYIANLKNNFGIAKPAYAGNGTDLLDKAAFKPWQIFRNVSYVFFVVVLVVIGFMTMFRFKINPQTVANIQSSLPRIVVGIILVTLSYAIAGFMIDLAWIGNWLIHNTISDSSNLILGLVGTSFTTPDLGDPLSAATGAKDGLLEFPSAWPFDILNNFGGGAGKGSGIVSVVLGALSALLPAAFGGGGGALATTIFGLILAFTVVGATFKIFFSLLTKYVTLIIMTMFLPIAFLWGSLPGQEDTTNKAIMTMLSAALAFPAVTLFLALAYYFSKFSVNIPEIPPLYYSAPFAGAVAGSGLSIGTNLVAIGLLTIIPSIPQLIDDALQVKGGGALGAGTQELGGQLRKIPIIGSFIG